jgi:hypothetical protein
MLNAKRFILGLCGLALIAAGLFSGFWAWMFNYLDTTGLGPQDIVILLACGAIIGLIAGIYLIWRAIQMKGAIPSDHSDNPSTRDPQR